MKKYCLFLTISVLTLSLFTGCGCSPQRATEPALPTRNTAPVVPETLIPTTPSEEATTLPESMPAESGIIGTEGINGNNGHAGEATGAVTESTAPMANDAARGRRMP